MSRLRRAWILPIAFFSIAAGWESLVDEDGIRVWQRPVPGSSLVAFRAIGDVDAPITRVAAVIRNDARKIEWIENCIESSGKKYFSVIHVIAYARIASPVFFVNDRDSVVEVKAKLIPEDRSVRIDFHDTVDKVIPEREGIVRVPKLRGHWLLTRLSDERTRVSYEVEADPGGSLPAWIVNWASKQMPYKTIANLRTMVNKPGFEKDQALVEAALDWDAITGTSSISR
jgi:hypothetical protein